MWLHCQKKELRSWLNYSEFLKDSNQFKWSDMPASINQKWSAKWLKLKVLTTKCRKWPLPKMTDDYCIVSWHCFTKQPALCRMPIEHHSVHPCDAPLGMSAHVISSCFLPQPVLLETGRLDVGHDYTYKPRLLSNCLPPLLCSWHFALCLFVSFGYSQQVHFFTLRYTLIYDLHFVKKNHLFLPSTHASCLICQGFRAEPWQPDKCSQI